MTPRDPVLGVLYGPPKVGKSTDLGYSFPRAIWIAAPGATAPLEAVCGYAPMKPPVDINELDEAVQILEAMAKDGGKKLDVDALILDDLTLYVDRTIRALAGRGVGKGDPRQLWGAVRISLLTVRDTARRAGKHVFFNAHEGPPKTMNGARIRGGPGLPGAGAEIVPAACDVTLRAVPNSNIPVGWKVEYRCSVDDQDYVSGDRYNVTPDHSPMNIGEILRCQGFPIRRHPEMAWQETIVEKIAGAIIDQLSDLTFVKSALSMAFDESIKRQGGVGMTKDEREMREKRGIWTQRDAYDRAILRAAQRVHRRRLYG